MSGGAGEPGILMEAELDGMRYVRALYERIDPDVAERLRASYDYAQLYSFADVGELAGFERDHRQTPLIDLRRPEEEILAGFRKNTRYEIRKAQASDDLRVEVDDPDHRGSYQLYADTKRADDVPPDLAAEFDDCRLLNAYLGDELSVTSSWYDSGEVLRLKHLASRRKEEGVDPKLIGFATRLLVWTACRLGRDEGRTWVDLGGINLDDPGKAGVATFKRSFGPEIVTVTYYRSCSEPFAAAMLRAASAGFSVL